jgi:hypothetical protein
MEKKFEFAKLPISLREELIKLLECTDDKDARVVVENLNVQEIAVIYEEELHTHYHDVESI